LKEGGECTMSILELLFGRKETHIPSEDKLFQDAYWFISRYPHGFGKGEVSKRFGRTKITISFVTDERKVA
jgi:hypothetical protein